MPNLRQQLVGALGALAPTSLPGDDVGVYLCGSSGVAVTVTKKQIQAFYATTTGSAAARKTATINWIKSTIAAALGPSQISAANITVVDFDPATGTPTALEVTN